MVICPACHAENPDGTKICVKCATELPKVAASAVKRQEGATPSKGLRMKDVGRDMLDALWLVLIILLIFVGFWFQVTNGTWHFTDKEEAKLLQPSLGVQKAPASHPKKQVQVTQPNVIQPVIKKEPPVIGEKPAVEFGSAETFFQKGKQQYDTHHYQSSFNYLKQALEIDPTYAKAYFGLGYLYSRFDMNDAAVRMYEMALRFNPDHVDSINNLAMMYYHAGNNDDALVLLQKAVQLDAGNADCQYNLGSIYLEKNQADEALQAFQKAVSLRPSDGSIYNNMALTYEKLGKKQEAQDSWHKVLQFSKSSDLLQQAKTHLDFLQAQG